jgi:hypothetical protein
VPCPEPRKPIVAVVLFLGHVTLGSRVQDLDRRRALNEPIHEDVDGHHVIDLQLTGSRRHQRNRRRSRPPDIDVSRHQPRYEISDYHVVADVDTPFEDHVDCAHSRRTSREVSLRTDGGHCQILAHGSLSKLLRCSRHAHTDPHGRLTFDQAGQDERRPRFANLCAGQLPDPPRDPDRTAAPRRCVGTIARVRPGSEQAGDTCSGTRDVECASVTLVCTARVSPEHPCPASRDVSRRTRGVGSWHLSSSTSGRRTTNAGSTCWPASPTHSRLPQHRSTSKVLPLRQGACGASAVGVVDLDVGDVVAHVGGSRRRHR